VGHLPGIVHGPDNELCGGDVQRRDQLRVHQGPVLPERDGAHVLQRHEGPDGIRGAQHASGERGAGAPEPRQDAVIEPVHGVAGRVGSGIEHREEPRVGGRREGLHLDVNPESRVDGGERLLEQRRWLAIGQALDPHGAGGGGGNVHAPDRGIVVDDERAVARGVNVEFHAVRPQLPRGAEGGEGVLDFDR
jgi:hypothetical protein